MFFKTLCTLFVASLFSSALAGNAMSRFTTDDNQVNRYCNRYDPPQGQFVCFQYNGNIRDHMTSTDASMHGYVNSAGNKFVVMFDGQTEGFNTERMDVVISNSDPCLEVSTLDSGGDTRENQFCVYSPAILVH